MFISCVPKAFFITSKHSAALSGSPVKVTHSFRDGKLRALYTSKTAREYSVSSSSFTTISLFLSFSISERVNTGASCVSITGNAPFEAPITNTARTSLLLVLDASPKSMLSSTLGGRERLI